MYTGEHKAKNLECIEINKPILKGLYASTLYLNKSKWILEVLAPKELMFPVYDEESRGNYTIGEAWTLDLKRHEKNPWPLENANYYLEINGVRMGEEWASRTSYRYEDEVPDIDESESIDKIPIEVHDENSITMGKDKIAKKGIVRSEEICEHSLNKIFDDEDFNEKAISMIASLPALNLEDEGYEEEYLKYEKERNRKEKEFFLSFRKSSNIPNYLKKRPMVIASLSFKNNSFITENSEVKEVKFIFKEYKKNYLTRIKLQLNFGKYKEGFKIFSNQWNKFTDIIIIEEVRISKRKEGSNIPKGKKSVYIIYEILNNISVEPNFHTIELLESRDYSNVIYEKTKLLNNKGINGFNRYETIVGYIDENSSYAEVELFSIIVNYECDKEFLL